MTIVLSILFSLGSVYGQDPTKKLNTLIKNIGTGKEVRNEQAWLTFQKLVAESMEKNRGKLKSKTINLIKKYQDSITDIAALASTLKEPASIFDHVKLTGLPLKLISKTMAKRIQNYQIDITTDLSATPNKKVQLAKRMLKELKEVFPSDAPPEVFTKYVNLAGNKKAIKEIEKLNNTTLNGIEKRTLALSQNLTPLIETLEIIGSDDIYTSFVDLLNKSGQYTDQIKHTDKDGYSIVRLVKNSIVDLKSNAILELATRGHVNPDNRELLKAIFQKLKMSVPSSHFDYELNRFGFVKSVKDAVRPNQTISAKATLRIRNFFKAVYDSGVLWNDKNSNTPGIAEARQILLKSRDHILNYWAPGEPLIQDEVDQWYKLKLITTPQDAIVAFFPDNVDQEWYVDSRQRKRTKMIRKEQNRVSGSFASLELERRMKPYRDVIPSNKVTAAITGKINEAKDIKKNTNVHVRKQIDDYISGNLAKQNDVALAQAISALSPSEVEAQLQYLITESHKFYGQSVARIASLCKIAIISASKRPGKGGDWRACLNIELSNQGLFDQSEVLEKLKKILPIISKDVYAAMGEGGFKALELTDQERMLMFLEVLYSDLNKSKNAEAILGHEQMLRKGLYEAGQLSRLRLEIIKFVKQSYQSNSSKYPGIIYTLGAYDGIANSQSMEQILNVLDDFTDQKEINYLYSNSPIFPNSRSTLAIGNLCGIHLTKWRGKKNLYACLKTFRESLNSVSLPESLKRFPFITDVEKLETLVAYLESILPDNATYTTYLKGIRLTQNLTPDEIGILTNYITQKHGAALINDLKSGNFRNIGLITSDQKITFFSFLLFPESMKVENVLSQVETPNEWKTNLFEGKFPSFLTSSHRASMLILSPYIAKIAAGLPSTTEANQRYVEYLASLTRSLQNNTLESLLNMLKTKNEQWFLDFLARYAEVIFLGQAISPVKRSLKERLWNEFLNTNRTNKIKDKNLVKRLKNKAWSPKKSPYGKQFKEEALLTPNKPLTAKEYERFLSKKNSRLGKLQKRAISTLNLMSKHDLVDELEDLIEIGNQYKRESGQSKVPAMLRVAIETIMDTILANIMGRSGYEKKFWYSHEREAKLREYAKDFDIEAEGLKMNAADLIFSNEPDSQMFKMYSCLTRQEFTVTYRH